MPATLRLLCVIAASFAFFALVVGTASADTKGPSIETATEITDAPSVDAATEVADDASTDAPTEAVEAAPEAVVDSLHTALLGVMMDAENLGYSGRFEALEGVVPEVFDTPFMAEKSVGRYWRSASEQEREQLLTTFAEFMVANYAGNFDGFSGESFEEVETVDSTHGTRIVRTRLHESDGDIVQLDYRLREVDGRWRIIDIYLNGTVSELALRRSEYSTLIQNEGFDALIEALREKIADLADGKD